MGISVNPTTLAALNTGFKRDFMRGLDRAGSTYQQFAMTVQSSNASEVYPMLGRYPGLREWVGNRVVEELSVSDFEIKNKPFEGTVRVPRPAVEDDNIGIYSTQAEQLGEAAARLPDKMIYNLIVNGFTQKAYDGKNFFDTTHSFGSNKGTTALSAAAYGVARAQMRGIKDDSGEVLDINPTVLLVPPALEELALQIVNADIILVSGQPQSNIWKGSARVVTSARLTDSTDWFLLDDSKVLKPFIWQTRKAPQLVAKNSLQDDSVFWMNEYVWGVDLRGNAGYGLPQLAFGAVVAGG
jgi:phage major head subunit gpT-like protein